MFFNLNTLGISNAAALAQLQERGVNRVVVGRALRAVTHLDISDAAIAHTLQVVAAIACGCVCES